MQFKYLRDGGDIVYRVDGETRFRAEEIGIAYTEHEDDEIGATMHKHGPADKVLEWYKEKRPVFDKIGFKLRFISSSQWDADDLDRFINCTGSLGVWLKKHGLFGDDPKYEGEQLLPDSGAGAGCDGGRDQEGVPEPGNEAPPGSEPRQQPSRGDLQAGSGSLRHPE
jgi:hypothetical protein